MKIFFSISIFLFTFYSLSAQWEPMNGPLGGSINDLVQNEFYQFASTSNGLYRSDDNGRTWERILIGLGSNYSTGKMAIRQSQLVVLASSSISGESKVYLVKSDDNGNSWTTITLPDVNYWADIAINPYGIYISDNHLWVSTDQGQTWNHSSLYNVGPGLIQYNDQIFVGVYHTIFKSKTDADEWSGIEVDGLNWGIHTIQIFDSILFVRDETEKLLISDDGGESWTYSLQPSYWGYEVNFIKINDAFYGCKFDNILKSEDNGLTWDSIGTETAIRKMIVVGDTIIAGTSGKGIIRSMDSGLSFKPFNKILVASSVDAMDVDQNYLWTGCSFNGISRQQKLTAMWDEVLFPANHLLQDIKILDGRIFVVKDEYIYRSDDDGITWSDITPTTDSTVFSILYSDEHKILAGAPSRYTVNYLYKSSDYGDSWQPDTFRINGTTYSPSLFAKKENILFTADQYTIYRSMDSGLTWEKINGYSGDGWVTDIKASDSLLFVMRECCDDVLGGSTSFSRDNGDTWELLNQTIGIGFKFEIETNHVLIGTGSLPDYGIYISLDQARTWQHFDQGLRIRSINEIISDDEYLYAATSGKGVWRRKISDLYTTSIQSPQPNDEISIYPNPSCGSFKLKLTSNFTGKATLKISDLSGKVCLERNIELSPEIQVDTENLTSGLYILSIRSGEKVFTGKMVVQK